MTALSARLTASQHLRDLAFDHAGVDDHQDNIVAYIRSALLLSELATLLASTMRRVAVHLPGLPEVVELVAASALRKWWNEHHLQLTDDHRDAAREQLVACGVSDGGER